MKTIYLYLKIGLIASFLLLPTFNASSQWSNDPAVNTRICDLEDEQVQPKIAGTSDGGCYISWFDKRAGSYCVYLQKLDRRGNKLWSGDGLLISDQQQDSWLTDNCLIADNQDNAIITFTDKRIGWNQCVSAYKITPSGEFAWGNSGVLLSESVNFEHTPKVVQTSDGNYMFVWEVIDEKDVSHILAQKLSIAGVKMFTNGNITIDGSTKGNTYARIVPSDDGSVLVGFMEYDSAEMVKNDNMWLTVQKISKDGTIMFPHNNDLKLGIRINNTPGIVYYIRPYMASDGNDGAYLAWYDIRDGGLRFRSYIQHISSQGVMSFPENGASGTLPGQRAEVAPQVVVNPATKEPYFFWMEHTMDMIGSDRVMCRKFNSSGEKQWEDAVVTMSWNKSDDVSGYGAVPGKNGVYILFIHFNGGDKNIRIECKYMGWDGKMLWSETPVTMSVGADKAYLGAVVDGNDNCIAVWVDSRQDFGGIYAQNINSDGTLGDGTNGADDGNGTSSGLYNSPNPFGDYTVIGYTIPADGHVTLRLFTMDGRELMKPVDEYLSAGIYNYRLDADGFPAGIYYYTLSIGARVLYGKMVRAE